MIRQITGTVLGTAPGSIVIEVAGFGLSVLVPSSEDFNAGATSTLHTYLAVRQDGMELFGFTTPEDLQFFERTLSIPGVGPKTALSFLRRASRESLENAIAARDITYLTRVVGLGKKAAEKMILELAEKMVSGDTTHGDDDAEIFDTLVALGYTEREARKALGEIPKTLTGRDERLKAALGAK